MQTATARRGIQGHDLHRRGQGQPPQHGQPRTCGRADGQFHRGESPLLRQYRPLHQRDCIGATQDNVQFNGSLNVGYDLTYTYSSEAGKKFQLESVKDVNYRTEETPEGQQIENGHVYSYDKNGNLVYVNTNRVMTDGHRDNSVGERKLIWDEENRLLAVDDNGFVSNYWYDADGERTVKTSGESDQVYVNGVFSGGSTNTAKFSLYVSPYLVANQGGRYTKHIYAGSQRIVSKVGDFASYGSDPRRIEYAGANTDGLSVDYKSKYAAQQQVIKDNYKFFDVPYNGTDNDNYADGEGFCCNDGSMEAAVAQARKAQTRAVSRSFKDPDNYENLQFFYHPDHLGSSSFITNLDGEVVQHIEYVPFGEVFIEERNNVWNTPYLFNAKEFDEETGMYYYGARYYEPRLSLWISPDPLGEIFSNSSSHRYVKNNPLRFIDPTGLFETEAEAQEYADINFPGAEVHQDTKSQQWFVSLNEEGTAAYKTGLVLTRDFGPNNPYNMWNSDLNTAVTAFGIAHGTKTELIKYATKGVDTGSSLTKYFNAAKTVGKLASGVGAVTSVAQVVDYYNHGGNRPEVYFKYALDFTICTAAIFTGGTALLVGTAIYFIVDVATDGFGFDYSVPQPIVEEKKGGEENYEGR